MGRFVAVKDAFLDHNHMITVRASINDAGAHAPAGTLAAGNNSIDTQVVQKGPSAVPSEMVGLFQGNVPEQLFKLVRLRRVKGRAVLLETAYMVSTFCPGLPLDDLKNQSLYELIEKRYNLKIHKVAGSYDITLLGEREAGLLKLPTGKEAILYDQLLYLQGDQILGLIRSICPSGEHRMSHEWIRRE